MSSRVGTDPSTEHDLRALQQAIRARCAHPTGTFVPFRKEETERSIPARFEQQVSRDPGRLALRSRGREWSYGSLNQAANRLAHAILERRGPRPEPVALLLERGAALVVAIMGALKAGRFYVPLDPSFPRARLAYLLEDSQARLVLTNTRNLLVAHDLARDRCPLVNLDELDSQLPTDDPVLAISPDAVAHVFYTSGSTGRPKGVVGTHRSALHVIRIETNAYRLCADDRLTSLTSAGWDVFRALLNGGSVYPVDVTEEGLPNLAGWLIHEEITTYSSVATLFRNFVAILTGQEEFPRLRLVELFGEPVYRRDVDLYRKHFVPGCILVNTFGATEVVHASHYFVGRETRLAESIVPGGYAVEDKEILVLDDDGREAGIDQVGEIAVRSRYLSPGYWRRPDLTDAVFMCDPDGRAERLYRTGDLGRQALDGCLVHLGRKDRQVKIRGNRVDVTEIEAALLGVENVKEAVVVAQTGAGDPRLVAYVVPATQPAPSTTALRRVLAETLPISMIPSAFVALDAVPLTPTGKVDRRALPEPRGARPALSSPFVAPRTPVEATLAQIWAEILGLDEVGIDDHFLDLGGDSLLAGQVCSRAMNAFRVEVGAHALFQCPTVADMAVDIVQHWSDAARRPPE